MKINVDLEGQMDVQRALLSLKLGAVQNTKDAIAETAAEVERKAKARVPTKGGETGRSIRTIVRDAGLTATVGTAYYVARFIHNGTMPHRIKSKAHKVIEFEVGGETMVRGSVSHPGIPANPFMLTSYEEERPRYLARIRGALGRAVRDAGR